MTVYYTCKVTEFGTYDIFSIKLFNLTCSCTDVSIVKSISFFSEYNQFKKDNSVSFFEMVRTPSMACEITLQVI